MNYQEEVEAAALLNKTEVAGWNRDVQSQEPLTASAVWSNEKEELKTLMRQLEKGNSKRGKSSYAQ